MHSCLRKVLLLEEQKTALSLCHSTYRLISFASAKDRLRHLCKFNEGSNYMPARNLASTDKSLPPRVVDYPYISQISQKNTRWPISKASGREPDLTAVHDRWSVNKYVASKSHRRSLTSWTGSGALSCSGQISPLRIPDLIDYQNLIMWSSIQCQEGCWIILD